MTPIHVVRGNTLEAKMRTEDQTVTSCLDTAINQLSQLEWHCMNIIDVSKHEVNGITLEEERFDLNQSIEDVVSMFSHNLELRNLALKKEFEDRIPQFIYSDKKRLQRMLHILVGNAIKYSEEKGVITVKAKVKPYFASQININRNFKKGIIDMDD